MAIQIRRILVPIDFSDYAKPVIEWASHLARAHDATILLLHAYHLPVEFQQLEGAYLPPDFWSDVKKEATRSLAATAREIRDQGLEVEEIVAEGYPATVIEDEARRHEVDLVVIGTHGLSGLKHLLLGSVAERVVQKAPCAVLTVKKPEGS